MTHDIALALAAVVVLGFVCQWAAVRLRLPSVLLLLLAGVLVGPVAGVVRPGELGPVVGPAVAIGVAILLFEGGLSLRLAKLPGEGRTPVLRLVTIGAAVTWILATVVVTSVGIDVRVAVVAGAILVVSGPTVVLPLLRHIRPREPAASVLRWEGIFIDPVGATLAIVTLDAVVAERSLPSVVERIATTAVSGTVAGVVAAGLLAWLLSRHLVPDDLHNLATLATVVAAYEGANLVRPEAGLFAATLLGVVLANQRRVPIAHLREFEDNLGRVVLGVLFVVLGAQVDLDRVADILPRAALVLAALVLVVRPLAVWLSTFKSGMPGRARWFLAWMAPRGVVAIAVASLFANELEAGGLPGEELVPLVFTIVLGTVAVYGLTGPLVARWLRLGRPEPRGVAFIGAAPWMYPIAGELVDAEVPVLLLTPDPGAAEDAAGYHVLVYGGPLDSDDLELAVDAVGVSVAIAGSRTADLNAYGLHRLVELLGRSSVYHLPPGPADERAADAHRAAVFGRRPFRSDMSQSYLESALAGGAVISSVADGEEPPPADALPLVSVDREGRPRVHVDGEGTRPPPGGRTIYLRYAG